jgi:MFS family permease
VYVSSLAGFLFPSSPPEALVLRLLGGASSGLIHPAVFVLAMEGVPPERQGRRMSTVLGVGAAGMVVGPVLAALFAARSVRLPLMIALVPTVIVTLALIIGAARTKDSAPGAPRALGDALREMRGLVLRGARIATTLPIAFDKLTVGAFQALLPVYGAESLDLGHRGVSVLFLITGVAFAATQPIAGPLVDRIAPRTLCLVLTPVLLALLSAMSFFPGREVFFVTYVLYIVVTSTIFVATLKLVTTSFGGDGARHGGLYGSIATLTDPFTAIGPILFMNVYAVAKGQTFLSMAAVGVLSGALFTRYSVKRT